MKKIKNGFKITIWAFLALALICVNSYCFSIFSFFAKEKEVYAENEAHWEETTLISNSNFSPNSGAYPKTLSGWTSCDLESEDITKGVIDVSANAFNSNRIKYYNLPDELVSLESAPNSGDSNILMINNTSETAKTFYYTSSKISLEANSFYVISVWAKNYNDASVLIKLSYNDSYSDYYAGNSSWTEYSFIIATNQIEGVETSLEVGIKNSLGVAFFDFSRCFKVNENDFNTSSISKKIDLRSTNISVTNRINNFDFENGDAGWTETTTPSALSGIVEIADGESYNNINSNMHALKLSTNNVASSISFESDAFTLKQFEVLKLSFWAKSTCNAIAKLTVSDFVLNGESIELTKPTATTKSIEQTEGSSANNGWTNYSIILVGHAWCDSKVVLSFSIGGGEVVEGTLLVDGISLQQINYAQKGLMDSATTFEVKTFDEASVKNGFFNLASEISYDENGNIEFPVKANNWSETSSTNFATTDYIAGIVNTGVQNLGLDGSILNPGKTPAQELSSYNLNNILLIKNKNLNDFGMKSEAIELTKSGFFKVQLQVYTQGGAVADVSIGTDSLIIAQKTNLSSSKWQTLTFYIKTSTYNLSPSVIVSHANNIGCIFVDDVILSTITSTDFEDATKSNNALDCVFDLSSENFEITTNQFTGKLIKSTASNVDELIQAEVVNVNNVPALSGVGTPDGNDKVLMIKSADTIAYTFTSANAWTVSANGYFKVSVFCKVLNINSDETKNANLIGASIKLSSFEESFVGINNGLSDWSEYVFFINPSNETSFNLILGLGDENALTSGIALFDKITIETLEKETFETELNLAKLKNANVIKLQNAISSENNEQAKPQNQKYSTDFNWLWVPSLILAIALIIAIVVVTVKNVKIKPRKKLKKESYDKNEIERKAKRNKKSFIEKISVEDENEEK